MVDVRGRPQPELGAALACGEHDAEVVLPLHQEAPLLLTSHLSDTATQLLDTLTHRPVGHTHIRTGLVRGGEQKDMGYR